MKISEKMLQAVLWAILLSATFIFVLPYIVMISNSFLTFNYSLPYPPKLIPDKINLDAYKHVIFDLNILRPFKNSVTVTLLTTFCAIILSTLSAYAFAWIKFPGREILFRLYLLTLMVPSFLNIIPQFILLRLAKFPGFDNGLNGSHIGLIIVYTSTLICGNTFFMRGFFESLPKEMSESVVVDGGSHKTIFWKIMLPLSKPAIGTMALFTIQALWEEYFTAKIILGAKEKLLTLPIILQRLNGEHVTRFEWVFAASILMQIPIILLFIFFQKKFVIGGLTTGSVKG